MPSNGTKKNYRSKARSCPMCKPNKMHWADSRNMQRVKADLKADQEIRDHLKRDD